ncbi:hypothetical protein AAFF_G00340980 [Aldrovandia affinis]|uniref:Uncharacterized protein n=1 Tax=Aldrovandia affinis TaxID=143900 RepID=A0AAD7WPK6_9TELE|nr:hypothetical protein AAFF_G00340980 [Aldrovandia affinis]
MPLALSFRQRLQLLTRGFSPVRKTQETLAWMRSTTSSEGVGDWLPTAATVCFCRAISGELEIAKLKRKPLRAAMRVVEQEMNADEGRQVETGVQKRREGEKKNRMISSSSNLSSGMVVREP